MRHDLVKQWLQRPTQDHNLGMQQGIRNTFDLDEGTFQIHRSFSVPLRAFEYATRMTLHLVRTQQQTFISFSRVCLLRKFINDDTTTR